MGAGANGGLEPGGDSNGVQVGGDSPKDLGHQGARFLLQGLAQPAQQVAGSCADSLQAKGRSINQPIDQSINGFVGESIIWSNMHPSTHPPMPINGSIK